MTANIVPVCSITRSNVNCGVEGSSRISFAAAITCAELETGSNSARPWMIARITICRFVIDQSSLSEFARPCAIETAIARRTYASPLKTVTTTVVHTQKSRKYLKYFSAGVPMRVAK